MFGRCLPARGLALAPELTASGKLENQLGIVITRFAPVDGVLGYGRDKILALGNGG